MEHFNRYVVVILSVFFSITVFAKDITVVNEVKNKDGSVWVIEMLGGGYNLNIPIQKARCIVIVRLLRLTLKQVVYF